MAAAPSPGTDSVRPLARARVDAKKRINRFLFMVAVAAVALLTLAIVGNTFVRGMAVGILSFCVLVVGGFALTVRRRSKRIDRKLKAPPIPDFRWDYAMSAHDLEGAPVAFQDFAGSVLVLNFWATWCVPCIAEMPSLERLQEATSDLGVRIACVSREEVDKVRSFLAKRSLSLPFYVLADEAPECFRSRAIPATFILDRRGRIALRHVGAAAWDDEAVVSFVRGLAAPSKPEPRPTVDG